MRETNNENTHTHKTRILLILQKRKAERTNDYKMIPYFFLLIKKKKRKKKEEGRRGGGLLTNSNNYLFNIFTFACAFCIFH